MRIKTSREKRIFRFKTTLRWIIYYLIIFICFILMTSGTWLKPVLLVPAAICIAKNNDQMPAAFTGAFCGFLIDIACGRLYCYNAVLLTVFCVAVSLMFDLWLRSKFINYMWLTILVSYLQCWLDYKFYYQIWNYDNVENIFVHVTLRVWLYTIISSVILYFLFKLVDHFLMPKEHLTIEEVIKTS